jgi:hypothetical protein
MQKSICALAALLLIVASFAEENLREQGGFGMPQKEATVLCDTPELKVSVCNSVEYLMVQAIVWKDNNNAEGTTSGEERKNWRLFGAPARCGFRRQGNAAG